DLVERILQYFLEAHVHDMSEDSALRIPGALSRRTRKIEGIALRHQRLEARSVTLLQPFRIKLCDLEPVHDIRCHVAAGAKQRTGMPDLSVVKDRNVGGSATELDDGATQ